MNDPVTRNHLLIWLFNVAVLSWLIRVHHVSNTWLRVLAGLLWLNVIVLWWALVRIFTETHLDEDVWLNPLNTRAGLPRSRASFAYS